MSSDQRVSTPPEYELTDKEENKKGDDKDKEGEQILTLNLTHVPLVVQQQSSSVSSNLVSKFINPYPDTSINSILNLNNQSKTLVNVPVSLDAETPSSDTTIPNHLSPTFNLYNKHQVSALETEMSEYKQTNQFIKVVSSISSIVNNYLTSKMKEAVDVAVQLQTNKLREEAQAENQEFLNSVDSTMKIIIKEQVQAQVSKIMPKIEKDDQDKDEDPSVGSNRGSKKRRLGKEVESSKKPTHKESKSTSSSKGASRSQPKLSGKIAYAEKHGQKVNELEDQTHQEFNTRNDDVTPVREALDNDEKVLTDPTYDLIKGTCKSVVELEYHLEEVFTAMNDQLDWHNPEEKPYPPDLSKPFPLILNDRGRQVIPLDCFINKDLEYLKGWSSSQKYTTFITKTKAADYVQGLKCQKFYGHASNMETSKDVYSRHKIIAVTNLKIMKYFSYSYLEEIIVRRQDDQLYKFREEERYALNMALRMFTRRSIIQERVEDLQLGVESYQKKINLIRPDIYCSDLKRMTPYTAYPDILGIVYEDEMNRNCIIRIDELYKFSDGTLNHVHTALNNISTRIEMDYLPKRKWSKQDKQRACVMINTIDKKLRDRRLMRNL
nr:hypothetical protein [Tanacetum cinerariifolium]